VVTRSSSTSSEASQALQALISAAAGGDRDAQNELMERFWPLIHYTVRARKNRLGRRLAAREETVDLEQAAAIKVLTELDAHEWRGKSQFAAWVRKLATVEVIDAYRHHSAKKRDAAADTAASRADDVAADIRSMESRVEDAGRMQELMRDLAGLKEEYGAALWMHHLGFSHQEIGEALECSAEAARKLVTRARTQLLKLRPRG
jgi:RNA polymerase sigma factor (sigma-70 family)